MYYSQPILNVLAAEFGVSNERIALAPTLSQAGFACGLFLIAPIGDIAKRRPMVLFLMLVTASLVRSRLARLIDACINLPQWIGLTMTHSFSTFVGLSFLVGAANITPQLVFPLATQYAPPKHRATATAVVLSGVTLGILAARLISGIVTQYTSWRNAYWLSLGLQLLTTLLLFFALPDYPILQPETTYKRILLNIAIYPFRYPVLLQQSLIIFLYNAMFMSFWTTLTFQLVGQFHLSTMTVGLFAIFGIVTSIFTPPIIGLLEPRTHMSGISIIGHIMGIFSACVGTFIGTYSIAGPVVWAAFGDLGMDLVIVSTRLAISGVDPKGQNVVNSVLMIFVYTGQLTGTAVGNRLYAEGGWIYSGAFGIATLCLGCILVLVRGPNEDTKTWFGWSKGWGMNSHSATLSEEAQPILAAIAGATED